MEIFSHNFKSKIFKQVFYRYLLIGSILLLTISIIAGSMIYNRKIQSVKTEELKKMAFVEYIMESFMDDVALDLKTMKEMDLFRDFLTDENDNEKLKPFIEDICFHLMENKRLYNQIRFINANGLEIFRIDNNNGNILVVDKDYLQDKSNRYYFTEAIKLNDGEFYLSPLDLNIENKKVEVPYRPVIRMAVPVFDNNNVKQGIFILNFSGQALFEKLDDESSKPLGQMFILNKDGYFMKSPVDSLNWSFMFPNKTQHTLNTYFPNESKRIRSGQEYQFNAAEGLFTCTNVIPFSHESDRKILRIFPVDYFWTILFFIPQNEISLYKLLPNTIFIFAFLAVFIMVLISAYFYASVNYRKLKAQEELRSSEQALKKSNKTKDEFFSILSHDLRNSAGVILAFLDYVIDDDGTIDVEERNKFLNEIKEAAYQHHNLLNEILNWAKLQLNRQEVKPIAVDLGRLFKDLYKQQQFALEKKQISLEVSLDERLKVWADLDMMRTVFRNLLNNAIKFSYRDSTIKIIASEKEDQVEVRVIDSGVGIDKQDIGKLFDLLAVIQKRGTDHEPGSGFGLKLVAEMVAKNEGTIHVESELGMGSQFIVSLPASIS